MKVKTIQQDTMTSECWLIQIWGTGQCNDCEVRNTSECGGQDILKTGYNEKGFKVGVNGLEV